MDRKQGKPKKLPTLSNVIDLEARRPLKRSQKSRRILYLNNEGEWMESIGRFHYLNIVDVRSAQGLSECNFIHPDLILIEASLDWKNPIAIASELHQQFEIPIVMLCSRQMANRQHWLKQAYAAGVYDVLYTPLCLDELTETLQVLLKFQRQVSQFH